MLCLLSTPTLLGFQVSVVFSARPLSPLRVPRPYSAQIVDVRPNGEMVEGGERAVVEMVVVQPIGIVEVHMGRASLPATPPHGRAPPRILPDPQDLGRIPLGNRHRSCPDRRRQVEAVSYFGAFVRDPDGNNVEAVCHAPEL